MPTVQPSAVKRTLAAAGHLASSTAGALLRSTFAGVGRIRPSAKPLHPYGIVRPARVQRTGSPETFGVPWLDEPGGDDALVRFSRGGGLPDVLPDVLGVALRIDPWGRPGDLLFATTGRGRIGRFLLRPRRANAVAPVTYSTLQPYRTPTGPVVLSLTPAGTTLHLAAARPTGPWQQFGTVHLVEGGGSDAPISFDPFLHPVPGLTNYGWARRVREGAYAAARRSRGRRRSDRAC